MTTAKGKPVHDPEHDHVFSKRTVEQVKQPWMKLVIDKCKCGARSTVLTRKESVVPGPQEEKISSEHG